MSIEAKEKFKELFSGGELQHFTLNSYGGYIAKIGPILDVEFDNHLNGIEGLGVVPIKESDLCNFAAIDIDFYDKNRDKRPATKEELSQIILNGVQYQLPLHYFLSKSGSVHCYIFLEGPGRKAVILRQTLTDWAQLLGYPTAEIFPKQDHISEDNAGSGINIPYFGCNIRKALKVKDGKIEEIEFEEFITNLVPIKHTDSLDIEYDVDSDIPPCLDVLLKSPTRNGFRNQTLFNVGVLYKKQEVEDWEEQLRAYNYREFDKPLEEKDLKSTISSLRKKNYEYTCRQQPILALCKHGICVKRKFGVGKREDSENGYDPIVITELRKITTDPARYIIIINGHEIECEASVLFVFPKFRLLAMEKADIMLPHFKPAKWDMIIKDWQKQMLRVEAPMTASTDGQLETFFLDFLERSSSKKDALLVHKPQKVGEQILFRFEDLCTWLKRSDLNNKLKSTNIYSSLLRKFSIEKTFLKLSENGGHREYEVWIVNLQKNPKISAAGDAPELSTSKPLPF